LGIQWSLDGVAVTGATLTNFSLTNLTLPSHTVSVTVTNPYANTTSNLMVTINDTLAPTITLVGTNFLSLELGGTFTEPGATASDICAGTVPVIANGTVNPNAVGTNTLTYLATDGNGNTNVVMRRVVVRDTTPPVILWSFTNLVLVADANCSAVMPDVTGTNFILATDLSGPLTISQIPTNNAVLLLGTNVVILTIKDASGNLAYSTNQLMVQDQTPPVITLNGNNPAYLEFGSAFTDPGATAIDACVGTVAVMVSGSVNTNAIGTNTLTYTATDGNGNTNTVTRSVIVRDTTPPTILWSFTNLVLVADANCSAVMPDVTGTNFILATDLSGPLTISQTPTNNAVLSLGTNLVVIKFKDAFGNAAFSINHIIVADQTPPVITLNSSNPVYLELGSPYNEPGASANDNCAGGVPVVISGVVDFNTVGTNTLTYTATDGNGNTNTVTRSVIVRDTTPPTILWSFTNLVLVADANCSAVMPDVTGTNFILATDLSAPLTVAQTPTNNAFLLLGTNLVVITVADASGNSVNSTNVIVVEDQTPPVMIGQPQSQTNWVGAAVDFSAAATACTPLAWQWFFNSAPLSDATNATLLLSNLTVTAAGNYWVVATASGGASTSAVASLTVSLRSVAVVLASSENPAGFKDGVNFSASVVPSNATGLIQFFTNAAPFDQQTLIAGNATSLSLTNLLRGTNEIVAVYSGDDTFLPATNSLAQIVTNHPPTVVAAYFTNSASFSLNLSIADLATNWTDVDGDLVSLAEVSLSTNGITVINTGTALVYVNPNRVADQFTCTVTDGWGGTNFQTVAIAPTPPSALPLIAGIVATGGGLTLNLGGAPGNTYILEMTTNLVDSSGWLPVATNSLGTDGVWQFTDSQLTNSPQRFYRLELVQ
jgi:hypothetical protein